MTPRPPSIQRPQDDRLVLIGASTGGTEAIKEVLADLPVDIPGVVIVQHMPEMFTASFARRLDAQCALHVKEAEDGEKVEAGCAYVAPGHSHLLVRRRNGAYYCELSRAEPINRHRPAVDALFHSAARNVGARAIGVILTGMGKDGAEGLLAMKAAGAYTVAQDQHSSVVWGMPREAVAIGAAHAVIPLREIGAHIVEKLRQSATAGPVAG